MEVEKEVKILVVDDVEVNLAILEEIIHSMGYEAITAASVKEALEIMNEMPVLPQVILSDISMPDIDGVVFCARLKKNPYTRDIPFIFISAMDSIHDLSKRFMPGTVDYIAKPFDNAEVEMRIKMHLKLYSMQRNLEEANRHLNMIVARQMEKLKEEQKNIMFALAKLVESRDSYSGSHYANITYNCRMLAQGMQFSPAFENIITDHFVETIESSSALHDLGKIMIPDYILLKKETLNEEERRIMCTHAKVGAQTIMEIYEGKEKNGFINMAIDIAYCHHEQWDGSGYPRGLKGQEIPLAARIMIVVDVFDALIGSRVYKKPLSMEESLEIMREGDGKIFDPDILRVFFKIYKKFKHD